MLSKKYFAILILSLSCLTTYGQFNFRIRAGISAATATLYTGGLMPAFRSDDEDYFDRKVAAGYYGGVVGDIEIGKSLVLRSAINWSAKGWKKVVSRKKTDRSGAFTEQVMGDSIFTINYIEIPVNLLYTTPTGAGKAFIGVGPYIGYAVNAKIKASDGKKLTLPTDSLHRMDYGIYATIGYELKFGLFIEGSFSLGMAEVHKTKEMMEKIYWSKMQYDTKNRVFQIGIGYKFNSKKNKTRR